jgi:hypothetical protein
MPTLSDAAGHASPICVAVTPLKVIEAPSGQVGATTSVVRCEPCGPVVDTLSAASNASTLYAYSTPEVRPASVNDRLPGGVVPIWTNAPSALRRNTAYPSTPTSSLAAGQLNVSDVAPTAENVSTAPPGHVGAVVSAGVVATTDGPSADTFPAASRACTENTYSTPADSPEIVAVRVPADVDATGSTTPSTNTRYPVTPTLSTADDHDNDNDDTVEPTTDSTPPDQVGAVVSVVVADVVGPVVETFPAASIASTLKA